MSDKKQKLLKVLDTKKATYPADHKPGLKVPKGGSCCANCKFFDGEDKCESPDYEKFYGTNVIPEPPDEFCSDWWED